MRPHKPHVETCLCSRHRFKRRAKMTTCRDPTKLSSTDVRSRKKSQVHRKISRHSLVVAASCRSCETVEERAQRLTSGTCRALVDAARGQRDLSGHAARASRLSGACCLGAYCKHPGKPPSRTRRMVPHEPSSHMVTAVRLLWTRAVMSCLLRLGASSGPGRASQKWKHKVMRLGPFALQLKNAARLRMKQLDGRRER